MATYKELQNELADAVRDPDSQVSFDVEGRRLAIYRRLVFNNFFGLLANGFKQLKLGMGVAKFRELVRAFIQSKVSKTPYFAEISAEFCEWIQSQAIEDCWKELARYERAGIYIDIDQSELDSASYLVSFDLDDQLKFCSALALMNFSHKVYCIEANRTPSQEATWVLLYRNPNNKLRYKALNALSFSLLAMVLDGSTVSEVSQVLANSTGLEVDFLNTQAIQLLTELQREGALLGKAVLGAS